MPPRPRCRPRDFARMRSAKLGTLRVAFNWAKVEPTQGAPRDWTFYDTTGRARGRARPGEHHGRAGRVAPAGPPTTRRTRPPPRRGASAFSRFVGDVVQRYGHGGRFWRAHRGSRAGRSPPTRCGTSRTTRLTGPRARRGAVDVRAFLRSRRPMIRALRPQGQDRHGRPAGQLHARARRVPLPGRSLQGARDQALLRRRGHPPVRRERARRAGRAARIRCVMRRNGDGRTPVWITELGWATGGGNEYFSTTPPARPGACSSRPSASWPGTASATT